MSITHIQQNITLAVDGVVFTIIEKKLHVLLVQRIFEPFLHKRALPGGFVQDHETLQQALHRKLKEETSINNLYMEQLYTFDAVDRDPRDRVVSVVYMTLVNRSNITLKKGRASGDVSFFPIKHLPDMAFDHEQVIQYAYQRLRYKLEYTNAAQYLLPAVFTLRQLQDVYEYILQDQLDVRNFRKKIHQLGLIQETGQMQVGVKHRPAKLYEFVNKNLEIVEIL